MLVFIGPIFIIQRSRCDFFPLFVIPDIYYTVEHAVSKAS